MSSSQLEDLLNAYDMFSADHERRKWDLFARARQQCPVMRTEASGKPQYVITRYDDIRRILEDPQTFSSKGVLPTPVPIQLNPLDADPPEQPSLRKLLNPLFSRTFLKKFEPQMRASAGRLVDAWVDGAEVDFVADFTGPFVAESLATIVFDETDNDKMKYASDIVTKLASDTDPERAQENFGALAMLANEYITAREANPIERDDLLNAVTAGSILGRPLEPMEKLGIIIVLFLGGLDTTRGAISSIGYHLARDNSLEARLRDPNWVRRDMDEFLRLESPVACLGRAVTSDVQVGGVQLHPGDQVLIRFDSANRDETRFDAPDELRFDGSRNAHAAFGIGIHRCLGQHLARIQITIAFEELLTRITRLRLVDDPAEVEWAPGIASGPHRLPLRFDRLPADAPR